MDLDREQFCYIATRGRRTGRTHEIEIWYAARGSTLYVLAGGGERSDTVRNLRAQPACTVRVGDARFQAHGRVVEEDQEAALARALVVGKYRNEEDGLEEWGKAALPVAFELTERRDEVS